MLRELGVKLLFLAAMVSILFIAQAQADEQGWKKTIILPSGEVVCDLNGEWDFLWMGRGEFKAMGHIPDVLEMTQQGNSFQGVRMIGNPVLPKGSLALTGELDHNGFKKLFYIGGGGSGPARGKISKDGNTIEIKVGNSFDVDLTRR
jgi:hypothetical protein